MHLGLVEADHLRELRLPPNHVDFTHSHS
jgi:hypothetical protein